eukprot:Skav212552  [mRNA]  locus=scaffold1851:711786:712283:- [translate_table: standard]
MDTAQHCMEAATMAGNTAGCCHAVQTAISCRVITVGSQQLAATGSLDLDLDTRGVPQQLGFRNDDHFGMVWGYHRGYAQSHSWVLQFRRCSSLFLWLHQAADRQLTIRCVGHRGTRGTWGARTFARPVWPDVRPRSVGFVCCLGIAGVPGDGAQTHGAGRDPRWL